jgi:hypothetical protein
MLIELLVGPLRVGGRLWPSADGQRYGGEAGYVVAQKS